MEKAPIFYPSLDPNGSPFPQILAKFILKNFKIGLPMDAA